MLFWISVSFILAVINRNIIEQVMCLPVTVAGGIATLTPLIPL